MNTEFEPSGVAGGGAPSQREEIRAFVARLTRRVDLSDDQNIFQSGLVSSLLATQLVMFIEKRYCLEIDQGDLAIDNFSSVNNIYRFVRRKQGK